MMKPDTRAHQVSYQGSKVELTVEERGDGRPFLLLHGGAGPASMARFAGLLAARGHVRVLTPIHPGFAKTPRPNSLHDVRGLAMLYAAFLGQLGKRDVTVIGNSIGGWIAAELAILAPPQVCCAVMVSAAGIEVPGQQVTDVSMLALDQVMSLSYYNPAPFLIDPTKLTDEQRAIAGSNRAALQVYAPQMTDASLKARLATVKMPVLVISGEADRVVPPAYGRAFAAAIPGAKFELLARTGHVPQVETPDVLLEAVAKFVSLN